MQQVVARAKTPGVTPGRVRCLRSGRRKADREGHLRPIDQDGSQPPLTVYLWEPDVKSVTDSATSVWLGRGKEALRMTFRKEQRGHVTKRAGLRTIAEKNAGHDPLILKLCRLIQQPHVAI